MWLLADGPVPFSDGVCSFLGNGPSLFWLGKSKPFMLWLRKIETRECSTHGYLFDCRGASCNTRGYTSVCHGKKEKTHCVMKASAYVVHVGICWFVVVKKEKPTAT